MLPRATESAVAGHIAARGPVVERSGNSRMKNWGETAGQRKKVGGQHKYLSCMKIFRCNEERLAMVNLIKPNIGL